MVDAIKSYKKIISFSYETRNIVKQRLENEISISMNMFSKCPLQVYYRSVWGHMCGLVALWCWLSCRLRRMYLFWSI